MYKDSSIVTLAVDKSFGEGEDILKLKAGICGMIMKTTLSKHNNEYQYVVDFGPYGQWYCIQSELTEQDNTGWDAEGEPLVSNFTAADVFHDSDILSSSSIDLGNTLSLLQDPIIHENYDEDDKECDSSEEDQKEHNTPNILASVEEDIKRKMKQIQTEGIK